MVDQKSGIPFDKITNYLGKEMSVDLKNHHIIKGILQFYHLNEQMIHLVNWHEYNENNGELRTGSYMVINRTAWFQLYQ